MRISDWSSDVCSSDLNAEVQAEVDRAADIDVSHREVAAADPVLTGKVTVERLDSPVEAAPSGHAFLFRRGLELEIARRDGLLDRTGGEKSPPVVIGHLRLVGKQPRLRMHFGKIEAEDQKSGG